MSTSSCMNCRHWTRPRAGQEEAGGPCRKPSLTAMFTGPKVTKAEHSCNAWSALSYYRAVDGSMQQERRTSVRTDIDIPARLQTVGGNWSGRLADFSETGARLCIANPPRQGTQALLKCGSEEIFCKIAWSGTDACGLAFDRPVPHSRVLEIGGRQEDAMPAPLGAAADPARIPAGRKRARLQVSSTGQIKFDAPADAWIQTLAPATLEAPQSTPLSAPVSASEPAIPPCAAALAPPESEPEPPIFGSEDDAGYIKFYPFRAMANP